MVNRGVILAAVTLSGFSTLAAQVILPRTLHPLFGSSSDVGAAVVVTALAGLALGYLLGGVERRNPRPFMAAGLALSGFSLLAVAALWPNLDGLAGGATKPRLLLCAALLSFLPSLGFGVVSPLAIQAIKQRYDNRPSERPALVFGVGTLANVVGGLSAGYYLVPFVGLSKSLAGLGALALLSGAALAVYARLSRHSRSGPEVAHQKANDEPSNGEHDDGKTAVSDGKASAAVGTTDRKQVWGLVALAFYSGVASLAIEVSGTRMLASNFGPTTALWASVLAVSLGGLAVGYFLGGQVSSGYMLLALRIVVIVNCAWLLVSAWGLSYLANVQATNSLNSLLAVTLTAFLPTFILFGMESQLIVGVVAERSPRSAIATVTGRVFAASTIGGLIGALSGIFFLLPVLGISLFVRLAAVGYLLTLSVAVIKQKRVLLALALAAALVPLPNWQWQDEPGLLLAQREGRFQTIRIYTDEATYLRFHLGPTYESEVSLVTREPVFGYAGTILTRLEADPATEDLEGERVLVIGGAGHALAHAFETRGAAVTEVEVDPLVAETSNEFFGPIDGEVVIADGRRFVTNSADDSFDIVIIDAFDGPKVTPPHITTAEFYEQVSRVLNADGRMYINMIGETKGPLSSSFDVMSSTVASVFSDSAREGDSGNIVLIGGNNTLPEDLTRLEITTMPNTDDLNPMEIMTSRS